MAKIRLYVDNANVMRDRTATLGMITRSFVERLIGTRCPTLHIKPDLLGREWLRQRIFDLISMAIFTLPKEPRSHDEVFNECVSRYDTVVGKFIDENLDLIAEIKMGIDAQNSCGPEGEAKAV